MWQPSQDVELKNGPRPSLAIFSDVAASSHIRLKSEFPTKNLFLNFYQDFSQAASNYSCS